MQKKALMNCPVLRAIQLEICKPPSTPRGMEDLCRDEQLLIYLPGRTCMILDFSNELRNQGFCTLQHYHLVLECDSFAQMVHVRTWNQLFNLVV